MAPSKQAPPTVTEAVQVFMTEKEIDVCIAFKQNGTIKFNHPTSGNEPAPSAKKGKGGGKKVIEGTPGELQEAVTKLIVACLPHYIQKHIDKEAKARCDGLKDLNKDELLALIWYYMTPMSESQLRSLIARMMVTTETTRCGACVKPTTDKLIFDEELVDITREHEVKSRHNEEFNLVMGRKGMVDPIPVSRPRSAHSTHVSYEFDDAMMSTNRSTANQSQTSASTTSKAPPKGPKSPKRKSSQPSTAGSQTSNKGRLPSTTPSPGRSPLPSRPPSSRGGESAIGEESEYSRRPSTAGSQASVRPASGKNSRAGSARTVQSGKTGKAAAPLPKAQGEEVLFRQREPCSTGCALAFQDLLSQYTMASELRKIRSGEGNSSTRPRSTAKPHTARSGVSKVKFENDSDSEEDVTMEQVENERSAMIKNVSAMMNTMLQHLPSMTELAKTVEADAKAQEEPARRQSSAQARKPPPKSEEAQILDKRQEFKSRRALSIIEGAEVVLDSPAANDFTAYLNHFRTQVAASASTPSQLDILASFSDLRKFVTTQEQLLLKQAADNDREQHEQMTNIMKELKLVKYASDDVAQTMSLLDSYGVSDPLMSRFNSDILKLEEAEWRFESACRGFLENNLASSMELPLTDVLALTQQAVVLNSRGDVKGAGSYFNRAASLLDNQVANDLGTLFNYTIMLHDNLKKKKKRARREENHSLNLSQSLNFSLEESFNEHTASELKRMHWLSADAPTRSDFMLKTSQSMEFNESLTDSDPPTSSRAWSLSSRGSHQEQLPSHYGSGNLNDETSPDSDVVAIEALMGIELDNISGGLRKVNSEMLQERAIGMARQLKHEGLHMNSSQILPPMPSPRAFPLPPMYEGMSPPKKGKVLETPRDEKKEVNASDLPQPKLDETDDEEFYDENLGLPPDQLNLPEYVERENKSSSGTRSLVSGTSTSKTSNTGSQSGTITTHSEFGNSIGPSRSTSDVRFKSAGPNLPLSSSGHMTTESVLLHRGLVGADGSGYAKYSMPSSSITGSNISRARPRSSASSVNFRRVFNVDTKSINMHKSLPSLPQGKSFPEPELKVEIELDPTIQEELAKERAPKKEVRKSVPPARRGSTRRR